MSMKQFCKIAMCHHDYYCDYHFFGKRLEKHYTCPKCGDVKIMMSNDPIRKVFVNKDQAV